MPLSEYEQRVLQQMEQQLRSDDPKLASTLAERPRLDVRRLLIGVVLVAAGLGLLVGGVATSYTWLGVLGFVAMLAGVLLAISRNGKGRTGKKKGGGGGRPPGGRGPAPTGGGGFMQRQEDRWDRRRDDQGR